ncbi:MAG TPA: hypothetical protein DGG94_18395 [Micromonosporaceae bacterium]|nr:hypothetical protein [Micromonosporaceae bacterium]HCU51739.1 hypothetical protein [Micromonosporaceae bacterium]
MSTSSVVVYKTGSQWRSELPLQQQDHVFGHIRFIRSILESGVADVAGPFTRLDQHVNGDTVGMIVFRIPLDDALAAVAQDPAVRHGLLVPSGYEFYPVA